MKNIKADVFMDLRGVACPMNYVKAKLQIEEMKLGQTMLLYIDEGEPIRLVPVSLQDDGQEILKIEKMEEFYKLLMRKAV
ncbi:MAG: sulfurtransferase TusA family protein [Deltaproteobacteria bacterium]|nr:sulfurtransferase TusA family protein [Deltaproteobacteria bacterium]